MVEAGTCYDHLAGRLGVGLYGALVDADALVPTSEVRGDVGSGRAASRVFESLGIGPKALTSGTSPRRFAFACPDWTKRLPHLGGALGAAVCERFFEEGWVRRLAESRALELTDEGERALRRRLGLRMSRARGPCRVAEGTKEGEHS
jgi:hypothetical protein